MTDKVIDLWERYRPRKTDNPTTAIRRLLLRRKFAVGERVTTANGNGNCGIAIEVTPSGCDVRVLWDHLASRAGWYDTLNLHRIP